MVHAALNAALSPDASVRVPAEQVCVFSSFFPFFLASVEFVRAGSLPMLILWVSRRL